MANTGLREGEKRPDGGHTRESSKILNRCINMLMMNGTPLWRSRTTLEGCETWSNFTRLIDVIGFKFCLLDLALIVEVVYVFFSCTNDVLICCLLGDR